MSITWITPSGTIGTIAENEYFEFLLDAVDTTAPTNFPLTYSVIAGQLTPGLQLVSNVITNMGTIKGIPFIETSLVTKDTFIQTFTIRCKNHIGQLADRTFSVTVNPIALPQIIPKNTSLGSFYSGNYIDIQLEVIDPNPFQALSWTVIEGQLPNGTTMTSGGLITGFAQPFIASPTPTAVGWSESGWDKTAWDATSSIAQAHDYYFTVQVFDGFRTDETTYSIYVLERSNLTDDTTIITVDNTHFTVDLSSLSLPFLTTLSQSLPTQRQESNFAFQFVGEDLNGNTLNYALVDPTQIPPGLTLDTITGWLSGRIESIQPLSEHTFVFEVYCYIWGTEAAPQWQPLTMYIVNHTFWYHNVLYLVTNTYISGFVFGPLEAGNTIIYPLVSTPTIFTLEVLGDLNNTVTWITPSNLGIIDNGSVSELFVSAVPTLGTTLSGRPLQYYFKSPPAPSTIWTANVTYITGDILWYNDQLYIATQISNSATFSLSNFATYSLESRLPQGLILLPDGLISGRASFEYFTLDNRTTTFDNNTTSFDNTYQFTVTATDATDPVTLANATVSSDKVFTVRVNNFNKIPYENLYLRALPTLDQRIEFANLLGDTSIFPDELIYRKDDPWFGKATDIKFLFTAGLTPTTVSDYTTAMEHNHYRKTLNLGNIKTAIALDVNLNIKYEVVYVEVLDPETSNGKSPAISFNLPFAPYTTLYPNSLDNMFTDISTLGFSNRGALPDWMLDPQTNGGVLGFTRGVILAYTVPGASSLIAYRLQQNNTTFNFIDFVVDRYELDHILSQNFDIETQTFNPPEQTTFDLTPVLATSIIIGTEYRITTLGDTNFMLIGATSNTVGLEFTATGTGTGTGTVNVVIPTTFDSGSTRFFSNKDAYAPPEIGDIFLGFIQNNIYQ